MLNICDDIQEINAGFAELSYRYAKSAIFGNQNKALFFDLIRLDTYIDVLVRYSESDIKVKLNNLQGQKVSFSSLKKQNNNLILDTEHFTSCSIEYRTCLSDEEICKIIERAKLMCYGL